jgi:DNA-directed RNA polymerase sigma subunit (sigma70/sigma32)
LMNITRERVRQIELQALGHLETRVLAEFADAPDPTRSRCR